MVLLVAALLFVELLLLLFDDRYDERLISVRLFVDVGVLVDDLSRLLLFAALLLSSIISCVLPYDEYIEFLFAGRSLSTTVDERLFDDDEEERRNAGNREKDIHR